VTEKLKNTTPTQKAWVDFDPTEMPDWKLDALCLENGEERNNHRNFIRFIGPDGIRKERKVRVNCKYHPKDTAVSCPTDMWWYKKTTLVKRRGNVRWEIIEERVSTEHIMQSAPRNDIERMCVFLQEERRDDLGCAYYCHDQERVFDSKLDSKCVATMSEKQRQVVDDGIKEVNKQDEAMRTGLKAFHANWFGAMGRIVCLLPLLLAQGAAESAAVINNVVCNYRSLDQQLTKAPGVIDKFPADVIVSRMDPLEEAWKANEYMDMLEENAKLGKIVVHFAEQFPGDQRNHWIGDQMSWRDGRGNLSFATNDPKTADMIQEWADGESRAMPPKCINDVGAEGFEELLKLLEEALLSI
jgi:hypothetical protein